jgi:hypothetical protein
MPQIHQLIYVSAARKPFSADELAALLETSRKNNESGGLTGLLLYDQGSFLQLLEGDEKVVRETFHRIEKDPRHHRVMIVHQGARAERNFPRWSMGYPDLDKAGPERPDGFSDFFSQFRQGSSSPPDTSVAAQILDAFRQGRWHMYVQSAAEESAREGGQS